MAQPLMPKATAVWLVDNTALTFEQIADFVGMHALEIAGIADGTVAQGIKGLDPVVAGQLTREEIKRCERDPKARLRLLESTLTAPPKRIGPRYTPLSKRQDRPSAVAWLLRYHPELADGQVAKLVGTTKATIESVRNKTHWNAANIRPVDPVALGLCRQVELDEAVKKAAAKRARENPDSVMTNEQRMSLLSTDQSLAEEADLRPLRNLAASEAAKPAAKDISDPHADAEALFRRKNS